VPHAKRLGRAKRASSDFQFALWGFTLLTKLHKFINFLYFLHKNLNDVKMTILCTKKEDMGEKNYQFPYNLIPKIYL